MATRRPGTASARTVNGSAPYALMDDEGVVHVVLPVRRWRVLFTSGQTVDVESAGGLSSVERALLVDRYGPIAGASDGVHVGWTGPTQAATLDLPPESPLSAETGPPGTDTPADR